MFEIHQIRGIQPEPVRITVYIRENENGEYEVPTSPSAGVSVMGKNVYFTDDLDDARETARHTFGRLSKIVLQEGTYYGYNFEDDLHEH